MNPNLKLKKKFSGGGGGERGGGGAVGPGDEGV